MTNNTIPNVPRELLEELRDAANDGMNATTRQHQIDHFAGLIAKADALLSSQSPAGVDADHVEDVRAMVADPSPAGVDGLEVVGWYRMDDRKAITPYPSVCATWHKMGVKVGAAYSDSAHAIIDGLRGEVEVMTQHANNYAKMFEECAEERDHLAQCLKFARTTMAVVADNANLRGVEYRSLIAEIKRIDAKLASLK